VKAVIAMLFRRERDLSRRVPSRGDSSGRASASSASQGPLAMVPDAIASGAVDCSRIAENTGLARTTVDAPLEHLERMGWLTEKPLGTSCPGGGCSSCPLGKADGGAGCGSHIGGTGPVALVLTRRPQCWPAASTSAVPEAVSSAGRH